MQVNTHLQQLKGNYLFTEIANRTQAYQQAHPEANVLRLGIGDVTLPLSPVILEAMHRAVDELASAATFRGYGPEEGYLWLRQAIVDNDYTPRGIQVSPEEVFISDGAGSDLGNLSELFDASNSVAILEPSYPAYVDTSRMAGREIIWLPCLAQNNFYPALPKQKADIIYLCFPNNPTGTVLTRDELSRWVEYARANHSVILFDAAYEAFIEDPDVPHSIYEIAGEATYTPEGKAAIQANLSYYKQTAQIFLEGLRTLGYEVFGGKNAPYIWCRVPHGYTSWSFFDHLLHTSQIVCTPGAGFGPTGEGFVRFSAFSNRKDVEEALKRMKKLA